MFILHPSQFNALKSDERFADVNLEKIFEIRENLVIEKQELPSDPAANNGRGLLRQVYTPAQDQNEWEERYWDKMKWTGLQDAIFHFGHPIGELVFENTEIVTHESAIENAPANDGEQWVELPAVYG